MSLKYTSYALLSTMFLTASCSQENVDEGRRNPGGRIEFRASLPEISTRATEVSASSLDEFHVSAFTMAGNSETSYFTDKTFRRNSNTGMYVNYDSECIWPNNNDRLQFQAYAPSCGTSREFNKLKGFNVEQDIADQFDFVTATASGRLLDNEETGITLKFQHQLSRIRVKAWGNSESHDLEIAGLRIGGVGTGGDFCFSPQGEDAQNGSWESVSNGYVEYIFKPGDKTVTLDKTAGSAISAENASMIMGAKIGGTDGYDNSAMIIPGKYDAWNHTGNATNGDYHADGMYISVLLRVKDTTPYATNGSIVYPASEDAENAVYLAVDATDGKTVKERLYRDGDSYFTDETRTRAYDLTANGADVKAYGWAALPVNDELESGKMYTYTLNYSSGVGLRDPHDPQPGQPIIDERVLVNVEVSDWLPGKDSDITVPRK